MKSNTNDVRKEIGAIIKTATNMNVYYLHRPSAEYPYIVFELQDLNDTDGKTNIQLNIDVVSKDIKTTNNLADNIQDAFDHDVINTTKFMFHSYRNRRYAVIEDDKLIQRVHLTMDLYLYSKEEN